MATAEQAELIYLPLDASKREIRLVRLVQQESDNFVTLASDTTIVKMEIAVFSLDERPDFMALSYCWTKAEPERRIMLEGKVFYVRPNLHGYLKQVHKEGQDVWMFIDAICINQSDVAEKGSQVQLMGDVYRSATIVETWLGVVYTSDEDSARRLQEDADRLTSLPLHPEDDFRLAMAITDHLYSADYWTRLWIVQEILLARALVIRFGPLRIPWETFTASLVQNYNMHWNTTEYTAFYSASASALEQAHTSAYAIIQLRHIAELGVVTRLPLPRVLAQFSHQACYDSHDIVFGLLGLALSCTTVDYSAPLSELYICTMVECLLQIDILSKFEGVSIAPEWGISRFLFAFTEGHGWRVDHPTLALLIHETTGRLHYVIVDQMLADFGYTALAKCGLWGHILNFFYLKLPRFSLQVIFARAMAKCLMLVPRLLWSKYRNEHMRMPHDLQDALPYSEWVKTINAAREEIEHGVFTSDYLQHLLASTGREELVMNGHHYSRSDAAEALLDEYQKRRTWADTQ